MLKRKLGFVLITILTFCVFNSCDSRFLRATIEPVEYDFGYVDDSSTYNFYISSNTSQTITITELSLYGDNADKFRIIQSHTPQYIYPKTTRNIEIEFKPDGFGIMNATFMIKTNFPGSPIITAQLSGNGMIAEFDPKSYDFGVVKSIVSESKTLNLVNKTLRNIDVTSFDITGSDAANFSISASSPGLITANGGQLPVTVDFQPLSEGVKSAILNANTTDSVFGVISAEISGEGDVILIESFDNTTMCDTQENVAEWGTYIPGKLTPFGSQTAYNPTSDTNLDADKGPYNFKSVDIPKGVVVTVTGKKALEIYCQGKVIINGEINLDGKKGTNGGAGGAGGPGGYTGGDGGAPGYSGTKGEGPGGGLAAVDRAGGGGGYAVQGQDGFYTSSITSRGANGGSSYGNTAIDVLQGGSGGGGGAGYPSAGIGGGGGGGGGALLIVAIEDIEIGGLISANGGRAGGVPMPASSSNRCYGGGGGSGGAVKIQSMKNIIFNGGSISVLGGLGKDGQHYGTTSRLRGGYGSSGRVRLEDNDGKIEGIGGAIFPIPSAEIVSTAFTGGTGVDGTFDPKSSITLDTSNGPFNFTSVNIPKGVTITAIGNNPLEIYSTGDIKIEGTIDVTGGNAKANVGGTGVAGGFDGGTAPKGGTIHDGADGFGPGAGKGGKANFYGASGGGFGEKGQNGSHTTYYQGGGPYGTPDLATLEGGSGGGAGPGHNSYHYGSGGGAGGGAVRLQAAGTIEISGEVVSDGGNGTLDVGTFTAPGAGGSGGAILIQGDKLLISGRLSARGGFGSIANYSGGSSTVYDDQAPNGVSAWGGHGRIRLEAYQGHIGGAVIITKGRESAYKDQDSNTPLVGTCSIAPLTGDIGVIAQSLFYDSTITAPKWRTAIVNGTDLSYTKLQFQGADDNAISSTYTQWYDDLDNVPLKRYVRFKVIFKIGTGNPSIDDIELPFD